MMTAIAMRFLARILLLSALAHEAGEQLMHQEIKGQMRAPVAYACVEMRTESRKQPGEIRSSQLFKRGILYAREGKREVQFVAFEVVDPLHFQDRRYLIKTYEDGRKEELLWLRSERHSRRYPRSDHDWVEASAYQTYDLSEHLDDYSYRLLQDGGRRKRIWALPKEPFQAFYGGLSIELQEIAPGELVYRSIRFFDAKGQPRKEERYFDFIRLGNRWWRPQKIEMEDLQSGYLTRVRLWGWSIQERAGREDRDLFGRLLQGQGSLPCHCTLGKRAQ